MPVELLWAVPVMAFGIYLIFPLALTGKMFARPHRDRAHSL